MGGVTDGHVNDELMVCCTDWSYDRQTGMMDGCAMSWTDSATDGWVDLQTEGMMDDLVVQQTDVLGMTDGLVVQQMDVSGMMDGLAMTLTNSVTDKQVD